MEDDEGQEEQVEMTSKFEGNKTVYAQSRDELAM